VAISKGAHLMITEQMLTEVIESTPLEFDSHQVIIEVARTYQKEYRATSSQS
jgi:hypothetical protein